MTSTIRSARTPSGQLDFMFEHVDCKGQVSLLPLSEATQQVVATRIIERLKPGAQTAAVRNEGRVALTVREVQVLDLVIAGHSNKQIAYLLSISPRTVEFHRAQLMRKMGARNVAALLQVALLAC